MILTIRLKHLYKHRLNSYMMWIELIGMISKVPVIVNHWKRTLSIGKKNSFNSWFLFVTLKFDEDGGSKRC